MWPMFFVLDVLHSWRASRGHLPRLVKMEIIIELVRWNIYWWGAMYDRQVLCQSYKEKILMLYKLTASSTGKYVFQKQYQMS